MTGHRFRLVPFLPPGWSGQHPGGALPRHSLPAKGGRHRLLALLLTLLSSVLLLSPSPSWSLELADAGFVAVAPTASEATPLPAVPADVAALQAGGRLFEAHCVGCHVGGGNVIRRGRTLKQAALEKAGLASPEAIARVAADGLGQMSGYGSVLGEEGARQVGAWVWLQARRGWPRPPALEPLP